MTTSAVWSSMRSANASGGIVIPSRLGTNSTSNSGRESHWCPMVGKSSSPISTLRRPALRGRPEARVVSATETDGASAVLPAGAPSSLATSARSSARSGIQSEYQAGVPFWSQAAA